MMYNQGTRDIKPQITIEAFCLVTCYMLHRRERIESMKLSKMMYSNMDCGKINIKAKFTT